MPSLEAFETEEGTVLALKPYDAADLRFLAQVCAAPQIRSTNVRWHAIVFGDDTFKGVLLDASGSIIEKTTFAGDDPAGSALRWFRER